MYLSCQPSLRLSRQSWPPPWALALGRVRVLELARVLELEPVQVLAQVQVQVQVERRLAAQ